jgi:DNA-binding beta-propeller fold protein YncE
LRILFFFLAIFIFSCKPDKDLLDIDAAGYPHEVGRIILTKCAVKGCHNDISKDAAAGLSLTSWENMFKGADGESVVIPYSRRYSTLFLFINTHASLGGMETPTMPLNAEPLSYEEVLTIAQWIDNGALNNKNEEYFKNYSSRKKYFVTNQGCDNITVFDAESDLIMRYVEVGNSPGNESAHNVRVSQDNKYYYVVFLNSNVFQKYSTATNALEGQATIGLGSWNTFVLTPDGKKAFITDFDHDQVAYVNTETMSLIVKYSGIGKPHGIAIDTSGTKLLVTAQVQDKIYKIDVTDPMGEELSTININNPRGPSFPHEVVYTPDYSKYLVTCQGTNEVKVFKSSNDSLLASIDCGIFPQEIAIAKNGYAFISCPEDTSSFTGKRGSVSVIDYNNHTYIKSIYPGPQPHGIVVNEKENVVYVVNRNVNPSGPAPHHSSDCGGRNGSVTYIDLNTLELIKDKKAETAADPYSVDVMR